MSIFKTLIIPDEYMEIEPVLQEVLDQMTRGKGEKRHGRGEPFDEQITPWAIRKGYDITYQVIKKADEARWREVNGENGKARIEVIGIIVILLMKLLFGLKVT